jgi:chemotaxis protein CheY-P-specific phosphatase CheC
VFDDDYMYISFESPEGLKMSVKPKFPMTNGTQLARKMKGKSLNTDTDEDHMKAMQAMMDES